MNKTDLELLKLKHFCVDFSIDNFDLLLNKYFSLELTPTD